MSSDLINVMSAVYDLRRSVNLKPGPMSAILKVSEIRNEIYRLCLVRKERIDPYSGSQLGLTIGILRMNKAFHSEASSMLYAGNCFDLTVHADDCFESTVYAGSEHVASFLKQIGRRNASYIRHVNINFPRFQYPENNVTLKDDSHRVFTKIQSSCFKLSKLTTSLWNSKALEHPKIVEALALVDARFRAISSEIIVEVYDDGLSDDLSDKMKSHGWTIEVGEQPHRDKHNSEVRMVTLRQRPRRQQKRHLNYRMGGRLFSSLEDLFVSLRSDTKRLNFTQNPGGDQITGSFELSLRSIDRAERLIEGVCVERVVVDMAPVA